MGKPDRQVTMRAELPAAGYRVEEAIANVQLSAFAQRQIVEPRDHQAMAIVEGRQAALAALQ